MAIRLELGELYGCEDEKELMESIETLRQIGMSNEEINEVLERSRNAKKN